MYRSSIAWMLCLASGAVAAVSEARGQRLGFGTVDMPGFQ